MDPSLPQLWEDVNDPWVVPPAYAYYRDDGTVGILDAGASTGHSFAGPGCIFLFMEPGYDAGWHTHTYGYEALVLYGEPAHMHEAGVDWADAETAAPGETFISPAMRCHSDKNTGDVMSVTLGCFDGAYDYLPELCPDPNATPSPVTPAPVATPAPLDTTQAPDTTPASGGGVVGEYDYPQIPIIELSWTENGGFRDTELTYIYSDLGETCHQACLRWGGGVYGNLYCDEQAHLGTNDVKKHLNMNTGEPGQHYDRCNKITGPDLDDEGDANPDIKDRSTDKLRGAGIGRMLSPYARFKDSRGDLVIDKCFWSTARGAHKCFGSSDKNWRLCGCAPYAELNGGNAYVPNPNVEERTPVSNPVGWHTVSDYNCNEFCRDAVCDDSGCSMDNVGTPMGLSCDGAKMTSIQGVHEMLSLADATPGITCSQVDDRGLQELNSPMYDDKNARCLVNPLGSSPQSGCHVFARTPDFKWCYCGN